MGELGLCQQIERHLDLGPFLAGFLYHGANCLELLEGRIAANFSMQLDPCLDQTDYSYFVMGAEEHCLLLEGERDCLQHFGPALRQALQLYHSFLRFGLRERLWSHLELEIDLLGRLKAYVFETGGLVSKQIGRGDLRVRPSDLGEGYSV